MKKEIIDLDGILKVISSLFGKLPVSIHLEGDTYPAKVVALKNKSLIIYTSQTFPNKLRILSVVHNGSKFLAQLTLIGGDGHGTEILQPEKIIIVPATREGNRVDLNTGDSGSQVVTNLINVSDISKAIGFVDKKIETILQIYREKLNKAYSNSSIFFADRADNRLKLMQHYDKPIYILDRLNKGSSSPSYLPYDEYLRIFKSSKLTHDLISEISIPIRYKRYHEIGYVQILSDTSLENEAFEYIQIFADNVARDIIATGIFSESKEICQVKDLSIGGISFIHSPSRTFTRSITLGATLVFDLILSKENRGTFQAVIKNIRNQENDYRVGCQFLNTSAQAQEVLEAYLNIGKEPKKDEDLSITQAIIMEKNSHTEDENQNPETEEFSEEPES